MLTIRPGDTWAAVGEGLLSGYRGIQPAVKLNAYASRFEGLKRDEQVPSEEFALLLYLVGEAGASITTNTNDAEVLERIVALKPLEEMLNQLPVGNPEVRNVVPTGIRAVRRDGARVSSTKTERLAPSGKKTPTVKVDCLNDGNRLWIVLVLHSLQHVFVSIQSRSAGKHAVRHTSLRPSSGRLVRRSPMRRRRAAHLGIRRWI